MRSVFAHQFEDECGDVKVVFKLPNNEKLVGGDGLNCHQIEGSVVMVEQNDDQLDDFLNLLQPEVSYNLWGLMSSSFT